MRNSWQLLVPLLAGCAAPAVQPSTNADLNCRQYLTALDRAVDTAKVRDQGPRPIPGFPYLRVNRFLASFGDEVDDEARFAAWVSRLARLDQDARTFEITNLPDSERQQLTSIAPAGKGLIEAADTCRDQLVQHELPLVANRDLLREQARVPDDYVTAWRILGLYPITALFVKAGISSWHRDTKETYALPLEQLPQQGQWRSWASSATPPMSTTEIADILRTSADNPLAIPEPDAVQRDALFTSFAPKWVIDTVDENDLPGTPYFGPISSTAQVDISRPAVFRHLSHTRFGDEVLLQLNYIIWFKSRPKASSLDIYAGEFDGINFRVTLGSDGHPLLFDTIHNCGCYHMFFPVTLLTRNDAATGFWTEQPLVPQVIDIVGEVPVVHVSSRAHFVQRLSFSAHGEVERYQWDDYIRLRSLEVPNSHRRSLFGKYGLIDGSERPERVLLWPMGIRSPGAMRQWGRHSTAFVGRRHFDDPYLIEQLFTLTEEREIQK